MGVRGTYRMNRPRHLGDGVRCSTATKIEKQDDFHEHHGYQEDEGEVKELRGTLPSCFKVPWSSWPSTIRPSRPNKAKNAFEEFPPSLSPP